MKKLNPRIRCRDGVSLSVQANECAYCIPREDEAKEYTHVEVGFIEDHDGKPFTPPDTWREYADSFEFPSNVYRRFSSNVYNYVPVGLVKAFIEEHGGEWVSAKPFESTEMVEDLIDEERWPGDEPPF